METLEEMQEMFTVGAILESKGQNLPRTKKAEPKKWLGREPKKCDICNQPIKIWFVDGRTLKGYWALMCPVCFEDLGVGLGTGKGQMYDYNSLLKIEG